LGRLIVCLGIEKNLGTTVGALSIANVSANKLNKEVLLIDLSKNNPDIFKYLSDEEYPDKNIDIVMSYAVSNENISTIIKANTEKLTSSKLEIIMGTTSHEDFTEAQFINLIKTAKETYELVVIDCSIDSIPGVILDYADTIILFASQSKLLLNKVITKYNMILKSEKCKVIINKFEKNILSLENIGALLHKKIEFKFCYSKSLIKRLNDNNLNISESNYEEDVSLLVNKLFDSYGIKIKKKFSLYRLFNISNRNKDVLEDVKIIREA
jgi:hypothetical protein